MMSHCREARPSLRRLVPAIVLSAALLAPPALAQSPSPRDAGSSWCGNGRDLSFVQRISGCGVILAFKRAMTRVRVLVHDWRGQLYASNGDYAAAVADFSAAIRLDPSYFIAYGQRADVYLATGDARQAVEDYSAYFVSTPIGRAFTAAALPGCN
jgi:tetratricopeptide (TPR) repeat protein